MGAFPPNPSLPEECPISKRVLIVDDDPYLLQTLTRLVTRAGHDVVSCSQFGTARNFLSTERPDVLITDIRLGAYNGLQLIVRLKQDHPGAIAIALTGFDDPAIRDQAWQVGASFFVKPVSGEQLLHRISDAATD